MAVQSSDSAQKGPGVSGAPKSTRPNGVSTPAKGVALPQPKASPGGKIG